MRGRERERERVKILQTSHQMALNKKYLEINGHAHKLALKAESITDYLLAK